MRVTNRTFGEVVNPTPIERSEPQILSTWEFSNRPTRLNSVTVRFEMMDRFKTRLDSVRDNKRRHQFYVIWSWNRCVLHLESRIAGILETLWVSPGQAQTEFPKYPTYRVMDTMGCSKTIGRAPPPPSLFHNEGGGGGPSSNFATTHSNLNPVSEV